MEAEQIVKGRHGRARALDITPDLLLAAPARLAGKFEDAQTQPHPRLFQSIADQNININKDAEFFGQEKVKVPPGALKGDGSTGGL